MLEHTPEAAEAICRPPSCIATFSISSLPATRPTLVAAFALSCAACGRSAFEILAYPRRVGSSDYLDMKPGDVFYRPPHRLRCVSCRKATRLFDARKQGYDGVLNGGCSCESGLMREAPIPGAFRVVASFFYNIELGELRELAAEANVMPSDLFDAFAIVGTPIDGGPDLVLDYECA